MKDRLFLVYVLLSGCPGVILYVMSSDEAVPGILFWVTRASDSCLAFHIYYCLLCHVN